MFRCPEQEQPSPTRSRDNVGHVIPLNSVGSPFRALLEPADALQSALAITDVASDQVSFAERKTGSGKPFVQPGLIFFRDRSEQSVSPAPPFLQEGLVMCIPVSFKEEQYRARGAGIESRVHRLGILGVRGPDQSVRRPQAVRFHPVCRSHGSLVVRVVSPRLTGKSEQGNPSSQASNSERVFHHKILSDSKIPALDLQNLCSILSPH